MISRCIYLGYILNRFHVCSFAHFLRLIDSHFVEAPHERVISVSVPLLVLTSKRIPPLYNMSMNIYNMKDVYNM